MSSRIFQSVIVQMKEATDRMIGVIDADSNVISCSDTSLIGEKWPEAVIRLNSAPDSIVVVDKKTFKPLVSWSAYFDYAVFAEGDDEIARSLCVMAYVALNGAKTYYEEKHDKGTFVKNIITDNILPGDVYIRAKELHFVTDVPRAVFLIRQVSRADVAAVDVLAGMFAALLCQLPARDAVQTAVWLHGRAGDLCAERMGEYAMNPTDVIAALPEVTKPIIR